jgi:hypothetical protein
VSGIQLDGNDVLLLGQQRSQSLEKPADWNMEILVAGLDGNRRCVHKLPAGNWQMVRDVAGGRLYLYDTTENAGIACYDKTKLCWNAPTIDAVKAIKADARLLWLGLQRFGAIALDGRVQFERDLDRNEEFRWTTACGLTGGGIVLGGYTRASHAFALARLDQDGRPAEKIIEHPLDAVFPRDVIERALADDCCGVDIYEVARLRVIDAETLVVGLGGAGETLGACSGASALGIVRLGAGEWTTQVVDTNDGISGMVHLRDGRLLMDFCGNLRFYAQSK